MKLTKNELRDQQQHLAQLEKYLPTLQLKKAMLQAVVQEVRQQGSALKQRLEEKRKEIEHFSVLLAGQTTIDFSQVVRVKNVEKRYENVAGVEIPYFESCAFESFSYSLFETDPWVDRAIQELRALAECVERFKISEQQREALEREWREVSIRVNLFEKILIPRAIKNIRTIKVFLGDQELASVSRAKVAKRKIELREKRHA